MYSLQLQPAFPKHDQADEWGLKGELVQRLLSERKNYEVFNKQLLLEQIVQEFQQQHARRQFLIRVHTEFGRRREYAKGRMQITHRKNVRRHVTSLRDLLDGPGVISQRMAVDGADLVPEDIMHGIFPWRCASH